MNTASAQYCVIVMRNLYINNDKEDASMEDPVTVYGPFTKAQAHARAEQFNGAAHHETAEGEPYYAPVDNAPAFLDQKNWNEHWAIVRPMNDVTW